MAGRIRDGGADGAHDPQRAWERVPDPVCTIGADGRLVRANPAWGRVLGLDPAGLEGARLDELAHPDDAADVRAWLERLATVGEPGAGHESRWRHADGGHRWLRWSAAPDGRRIHAIAREVTGERARQARLRERNRLWESSRDLLVIIGMDGRYRECNPAWRTELGHDPEALVGTPFDALVHPDQLEAVRERFVHMAGGGRVADYEIDTRAADGSYRRIAYSGYVEGDAILVIGRDVEERRRRDAELAAAEEALRQSQKLETIGRLTGGVAHDFNNLLMAVQASLEQLADALGSEDRRERALVADALEGVSRGASLVQRLLAFARRQDLATAAVDVGSLVDGMVELLSRALGPRVSIRTSVAEGTPPAAVDAGQLEMALLNLAVNARDAMDGEGEIGFAVGPCGPGGEASGPGGGHVSVTVRDTGRGMDPATLARAAEPFFTTKAVGAGTGLGLSMVHGLAEQSGGRLALRSEPGVGTAAEIVLPAAADEAPARIPPTPSPSRGKGAGALRILAVDDDALVLRAMKGLLGRLGHEVRVAESGEAALRALADGGPVDVVVTDQLMPGMTGLKLAARIRAERPGTRIVLATGYTGAVEVPRGLVDARLAKPFDRARLEAALAGPPTVRD